MNVFFANPKFGGVATRSNPPSQKLTGASTTTKMYRSNLLVVLIPNLTSIFPKIRQKNRNIPLESTASNLFSLSFLTSTPRSTTLDHSAPLNLPLRCLNQARLGLRPPYAMAPSHPLCLVKINKWSFTFPSLVPFPLSSIFLFLVSFLLLVSGLSSLMMIFFFFSFIMALSAALWCAGGCLVSVVVRRGLG